jgi:hypothetical protein
MNKTMKATIVDATDINDIKIAISGTAPEMDINTFARAEIDHYEVLEVVDYWDGDGYIEYYCDQFKDYRFIAEACFEREGQDFIPLEITSTQLTIEPIKETA